MGMELTVAFRILQCHRDNQPRKWLFWKSTVVPKTNQVDEAIHALALASPENAIPNLAGLIWNADDYLRQKLQPIFNFLLQSIDSELPGVSKIARKRLFEIRRIVGVELVTRQELWNNLPEATRPYIISIAYHFQKWDCLEFLLARLGRSLGHTCNAPARSAEIRLRRPEEWQFV